MSKNFFKSLGDPEKKKPDWNKGITTPQVHPEPLKTPKIVKPVKVKPRVVKTPQINEKQLISVIGKMFDEKLQNFTETIKPLTPKVNKPQVDAGNAYKKIINDIGIEIGTLRGQLDRFLYNKKNLILAIHRRVNVKQEWRRNRKPKGIKADNLMPRFGEQVTRDEIQEDLRELRNGGILNRNKDGWYNFTIKGLEFLDQFL